MDHDKILKLLLGIEPSAVSENVLVTPVLSIPFLKKLLNSPLVVDSFVCRTLVSKEITVIKTSMGASVVGDVVLSLKNTPAKNLFFIGSCGGVNANLDDIILAEKAVVQESFSLAHDHGHQMPGTTSAFTGTLFDDFAAYLGREKIRFKKGAIFTAGSLYFETEKNMEDLKQNNILGIDLETSAFYTACALCGFESLAALYVTDLPGSKPFYENSDAASREMIKASRDSVTISVTDFIKNMAQAKKTK
jgi:purine-nucleoside phosphorylase